MLRSVYVSTFDVSAGLLAAHLLSWWLAGIMSGPTDLLAFSVSAAAAQSMLITQFNNKNQKQLGGNPAHVPSSCTLCGGSYLLPAAPSSPRSAFSGCLLPINQPLMLDASQLFEHNGDPMYIASVHKSCPSRRRVIHSSVHTPFSSVHLFVIF